MIGRLVRWYRARRRTPWWELDAWAPGTGVSLVVGVGPAARDAWLGYYHELAVLALPGLTYYTWLVVRAEPDPDEPSVTRFGLRLGPPAMSVPARPVSLAGVRYVEDAPDSRVAPEEVAAGRLPNWGDDG